MYSTVSVKKHATHSNKVRLAWPGPNNWPSMPLPAALAAGWARNAWDSFSHTISTKAIAMGAIPPT
ncbi:hypothetical protein D3C81_2077210 [compost metagenome]